MTEYVASAMPRTLRFRLRRGFAETCRRLRCWVLEDGTNGEGGVPNKWAASPRWRPGQPEIAGVWYQAEFGNDAFDIHLVRKWEPNDEPRIDFQMRCTDFRRVALWYLWRWAWGEWFGVRRWLYYRWLFAHIRRRRSAP